MECECIGAIGGTHIPVEATVENPTDYHNRKGWHSVVLHGTVDHEGLAVGGGGRSRCKGENTQTTASTNRPRAVSFSEPTTQLSLQDPSFQQESVNNGVQRPHSVVPQAQAPGVRVQPVYPPQPRRYATPKLGTITRPQVLVYIQVSGAQRPQNPVGDKPQVSIYQGQGVNSRPQGSTTAA